MSDNSDGGRRLPVSREDRDREVEFQRIHDVNNQSIIDRRNNEIQKMIDASLLKAFNDLDIDYGDFRGRKEFKERLAFIARRMPREEDFNKVSDYVLAAMASRKNDFSEVRKTLFTTIITSLVTSALGGVIAWIVSRH